jgi:hypothetical protein
MPSLRQENWQELPRRLSCQKRTAVKNVEKVIIKIRLAA